MPDRHVTTAADLDAMTPAERYQCPGCGLLNDDEDCDRCEYLNLANGRYHYCGAPSCYCRNLPGLSAMFPAVQQRFVAEHRARMKDV